MRIIVIPDKSLLLSAYYWLNKYCYRWWILDNVYKIFQNEEETPVIETKKEVIVKELGKKKKDKKKKKDQAEEDIDALLADIDKPKESKKKKKKNKGRKNTCSTFSNE